MKTRHHPLLSPLAIASTLILLLGLGITLYLTGGRAFSPGDLSAVAHSTSAGEFAHHAAFADDCTQCHVPLEGVTNARCLDCHDEIAGQQAAVENLHGRLTAVDCVQCHTEHEGSDVDLVQLALLDFSAADHALLFPLTGEHATLACADCHTTNVYVNTPTTCHGCHAEPDVHVGLFGTDCANCHKTDGWQAAALSAHVFPLDHGGMGELPCATCHLETLTTYSCATCHESALMTAIHPAVEQLDDCVRCHQMATSAETATLRE